MRWQGVLDVLLLVVLAAVGAKAGSAYYTDITRDITPGFYQEEFGAAVLESCGRGFGHPAAAVPALSAFLTQKTATFDCRELPSTLRLLKATAFQQAFRYLMFVIAMYWKATGVSWAHLAPLLGAVHAGVVGLTYLTFRVVMARTIAVPLSLAIAFSRPQLSILPYLRDSTKTPFFMAAALLIVLVWTRPLTTRTTVLLCGLFGLVSGIGLGFRPDVVMWSPTLAIALFCASHVDLRRRMSVTGLGLCVALGAFAVSGWPILKQYGSGSNFGHVAILGFTAPFDGTLGVRGGPYTRGSYYSDEHVNATVNSYAQRVHHYSGHLRLMSTDYERYASMYFWEMVRTFPADVGTRVGASVARVLDLPFTRQVYESDSRIERVPFLRAAAARCTTMLGTLDGWGPLVVLAAFALLAARGCLLALGFAATVLYLAGPPALQFQLRHYSHLEMLGLLALGVIVQRIAVWIRSAVKPETRAAWGWAPFGRAAGRVAVCVAAIVLVPLAGLEHLRSRQQAALSRLFDVYNATAADAASYAIEPADPGRVLVVPQGIAVHDRVRRPGQSVLRNDYLVIDLSDACDAMSITMRIKYDADEPWGNFTRDVHVELWPSGEGASVRLFRPIYQWVEPGRGFRFQGLEFAASDLPCLAGLRRVPDSAIPLWLDLDFRRNWKSHPLYQTVADDVPAARSHPKVYIGTPRLVLRARLVDALQGVAPDFSSLSKVARVDHAFGVIVEGVAEGPFGYLAASRLHSMAAGAQVIAVGELFTGGFTLGLLKDGTWSQTVNVLEPGRFVAAVQAPDAGEYVAVIANVNEDRANPTQVYIRALDWVSDTPRAVASVY